MSTKTLRKRIALVAVSTLGFGVLSVTPSFAGTAAITVTTTTGVAATDIRAGISSTFLTATLAGAQASATAGDEDTLAYTVSSAPAGGSLLISAVATAAGTSATASAGTVGTATTWTESATAGGLAAAASRTMVGTFSVPGTYVVAFAKTGGATESITFNVSPGTSATTSLTAVSTTDNVVTGTDGSATITVARNAGALASDGQVLLRLDATPNVTSGAIGTVYGRTSAAVGPITATQTGTTTTFTIATNTTVAAGKHGVGTYRYTAFLDVNNNGVLDSGEVSVAYTHTLSAAAGAGSIAATRSTIISTGAVEGADSGLPTELNQTTLNVSVSDANGNPATGSITVTETTGDCLAGTVSAVNRVGTTNVYTVTATAVADPAFTTAELTAGFRECTITANGTGATTAPTVKIKLVALTNLAAASLSVNDAVGVGSYTSGIRQDLAVTTLATSATAAGDKSITVDTAVTSLTFKYTGNATTNQAGKYVAWTRTPGVMAAADGVNAINYASGLAVIAADGTITVANATTGAAGESFVMQFLGGRNAADTAVANNAAIKVTYATATPQINVLSPAAAVKAKFGDTTPVAVSLTDQFARPLASKTIVYSVSGRNPNVTGTLTTDANGAAAFNLADTSTSTSATLLISDAVALSYNYTTAAGAGAVASGAASISYTATGQVVGSVTITPNVAGPITVDTAEAKVGVPSTATTLKLTAQVYGATGAALGSGVIVKFTCSADDIFYLGQSSAVTGTLGTAFVYVYRHKAGYTSCTATAGGVASAASLPVLWNAGTARNIALSTDSATAVAGGIIRVISKVTDRWGNGVSGATVTFTEAGSGRIINTPATTDLNGLTSVDVETTSYEVGKNTVTASISATGEAIDFAGYVGGVAVAGVTAGNYTTSTGIEFTADKSTSTADALLALAQALGTRDQASATVDAAAEATDAANAATDAANAAAEAADAATAAAQDASDAVATLSAQVSEAIAGLKKQLVSLTNLVIKIQKKVKA